MRAIAPAISLGSLLLLTVSHGVWAQTQPPRTPALDAATERFEAGKRLFREGTKEHDPSKIERAYFDFKAAYAIYPGRGTLLNLVETELATRHTLDAMKHVREYARSFGRSDERSEYRRTFEAQRDAAFDATAHIEIVAPPAMRVVVDGEDQAALTPLSNPVDVMPGRHVVELVGAETLRGEVEAAAGSVTRLAFAAAQPPAAPVAPAPSEPVLPPAVTKRPADVAPAGAASFWAPTRVWGAVVGVAGLVSLGTGFVFATLANQDEDRAATIVSMLGASGCVFAQPSLCQDLQSAHDAQSRDHALNLVFVTVGAAAIATGAALMFWPTHSPYGTALAPTVTSRGAALVLRREF